MQNLMRLTLTSLAVLALAGCGDRAQKPAPETASTKKSEAPASQSLAAVLTSGGGHAGLARVAANSGLEAVLEGVGPYTVLAPPDAALKTAGGVDFTDPARNAEGAALLRAHILPGAMTRADIAAAIDRSDGKGAQMRTMAGSLLTFKRSGGALTVTSPDGATARLAGDEVLAANGVLQPVDGLVIKPAN
jgi:uncharacterized surface protein with fasciclin (FAS1) repeats